MLHPGSRHTLIVIGALANSQVALAQPQKMVHIRDAEHPHKWIDGPPSEIDCSLASSDFEYYIERCHDELTQWWINGHCINGVKTEVSQLYRCQKTDGSRSYCHDCNDGSGNIKHVCGSDSPNHDEACSISFASNAQGCGDQGLTVFSHQCSSRETSTYLRESFYCDEGEVYDTGPESFTRGHEWYYPFDSDEDQSLLAAYPELIGREDPFATPNHKYCLDCGMAIQICASDPGATCVHLGLPMKGSTVLPEGANNSRYEGGER
mmetsp:Transcript_3622/g.7986  ORF Transcript_3622/g.7986 Transcript_3622/m.7986 type:complete len:264 (-) Transcript_3622:171-962(-)